MEEFASTVRAIVSDPLVLVVFGVVLATVVANYITNRLLRRLEARAARTRSVWDDALVATVMRPVSLVIWVVGLSFAARTIAASTDANFQNLVEPVTYLAVIGVIAYFMVRFITEVEKGFVAEGADVTTANALGKLLRISVLVTAALMALQSLGVSIAGVLAFGGIGGIAVGFAARDLLANFFGSLMVYLDRPFALGEWIRSPDRDIEGTVEEIGWRLTRIRTFDQRPLYVPNSVFNTISVENPSRMLNRRINETIGVRYDDAGKVKAIVNDVREMLENHPDIDQERTLMVNFNAFGASSLDFFVYCFTKTTVWIEYHNVKEKILFGIMDIIDKHGAEVAFPTRTLHVAPVEPEPE